jgi:two-component system nitrate/nitrite sensor histidine kinase NarQ
MNYKTQKLLFLLLPTVAIGVWEFIRHDYEIPYLSHDAGHILGAIIVFLLTVPLLRSLFAKMEQYQLQLNEAQTKQKIHEEREHMARQLHDGFAQSLFFLSVKLDQIERDGSHEKNDNLYEIRRTVRHMHEDVRTVILHLMENKYPGIEWDRQITKLIANICDEIDVIVDIKWDIPVNSIDSRQYRELFACIREALTNIRKHADANHVEINAYPFEDSWVLKIVDDGVGFAQNPWDSIEHFGLKIMRDRAEEMGWALTLIRENNKTVLTIFGGGADYAKTT